MQTLEPKSVLEHFLKLCEIPHGSYNIDKISDYLYEYAKSKGLWCRQDENKNVLIRKPATPGYEEQPAVILQGHMDMVAVKEDWCELDLQTDGLDVMYEDGYLYAKGTSLGGDDGIAIAYALAILDSDDIAHPTLEILFTVNEEVGMDGAIGVDLSDFKAERILNIDSEEEGILLTGCAGGTRIQSTFQSDRSICQGNVWKLSLKGFHGGHSGADIHKWRGNAICVLARIMDALKEKYSFRIISFDGGEKDNAIPRFANALFCITAKEEDSFCIDFETIKNEIVTEYRGREDDMELFLEKQENRGTSDYITADGILAFSEQETEKIVSFFSSVFDGVISMSAELAGIVETSLNLGKVETMKDKIQAVFALRSSKKTAKDNLARRLTNLATVFGAETLRSGDYPAWEYRADSALREKMIRVFTEQYGKEPKVTVIHAGLECGILLEKNPKFDCISFGPDILDIHTTRERLDVASVERTWNYLLAVLADKE